MKLPDNLKRIRKDNNLSQEQLAEKLGVSRQAVSKWESGQSYPEMDKVLTICKLFNYNIDELMNENVKEVSENKQSKINFNKYIDDFFGYITKTLRMFESMKFGQKLKCIFEQCIVGIVILIVMSIICGIGGSIFSGIFGWIPRKGYYILVNIASSIYLIFAWIIGIVILLHIFKIRYLDYYEIVDSKEEKDTNKDTKKEVVEDNTENKKVFIENKKEKIIIRDPAHSESKFLNAIFKMVVLGVKCLVGFFALGFVFTLVMLCACLICSFLFIKTGFVFIGAFLCIAAGIVANVVLLELVYDFIINKKIAKTRIGIVMLSSILAVGLGIGMIFVGITNFNYVNEVKKEALVKETYNYELTDGLIVESWADTEYIESDNKDIRIEIEYYDCFEPYIQTQTNNKIYISYGSNSLVFFKYLRENIDDINNKTIRDYDYFKVKVYTTKENIQKLNDNKKTRREAQESYEKRLDTLREEVSDKQETITELNYTIENQKEKIRQLQKRLEEYEYDFDY